MTIIMNDSRIVSIAQIKEFVKINNQIEFKSASRKERYEWIEKILGKFRYFSLKKKEKTIIRKYIMRMTGISDAQLTRLIAKKKKTGRIIADTTKRHKFSRIYTPEDTARLIETDKAHSCLSGPATKKIFERMHGIFKDQRFKRLKNISVSHIYNLRETKQYLSWTKFFAKTKPASVKIGERRKPNPQESPGYLRVDTVHQGDLEKEKGVYHINIVDEILQWEIVGAVEKISEQFLEPLLEDLLSQFPFKIRGFHSDNGSEFINKVVSELLNRLLIRQTKSRARHCNDNALVEGKNGSIIRKYMGRFHIPQRYASEINVFYKEHLNVYLNYHRPCGFATETIDKKGKIKKVYNTYRTPFEALKSHPSALELLKDGVSLEKLEIIAKKQSDNECAASAQKAKVELFKKFNNNQSQKLQPMTYATFISGSYLD